MAIISALQFEVNQIMDKKKYTKIRYKMIVK
jgi:hypothetical protein